MTYTALGASEGINIGGPGTSTCVRQLSHLVEDMMFEPCLSG